MDDTVLSTMLHDSFDDIEAPTARLLDGALSRSRKRRRTARLLTGASAAALVSAITAVVVVSSARPADRPAAGAAAPASTATITSATPIRPVAGVARVATTPQALLQTALDTLPAPGHTGTYTGRRDDEARDVFVASEFRYNDGHGAAQVDVSLETGGEGPDEFCTQPLGPCTHPTASTTLSVYQGNSRPGDPSTAKEWAVTLFRADGVTVSISEWNSPSEKDGATTRDEPPFTREQLITWASNDAFTTRVSPHVARAAHHLFIPR